MLKKEQSCEIANELSIKLLTTTKAASNRFQSMNVSV